MATLCPTKHTKSTLKITQAPVPNPTQARVWGQWEVDLSLPVTLFVGTPLCTYGIAYRRVYVLFTRGLFKKAV